ncbi:MAG: hypothetical protein GKR93_01130 [Gammaproteobacteria bacterium]|nr:hypothetical protein [Gammaproteobacteria bacterium]
MTIKKLLAIYLCALALGMTSNISYAAASDGDLGEAENQYNKNKSNDKYKVVCRKEAPIGSRIKRKVCRTVQMSINSQRQIKQTMNKLRTSVGNQP